MTVAVVQGAIPQDEKWQDEQSRDDPRSLPDPCTEQALGTQLIVWPESALRDLANDLRAVPAATSTARRSAHGSRIVMGVLRAEDAQTTRATTTRCWRSDDTVSWYDKHHLVPFAEFFPVPHFVR